MSVKKNFKKLVTAVLATGAAFALGALAFAGTFLLTASWPWALVGFFFASIIDGQVYTDSVSASIRETARGHLVRIRFAIAKRILRQHDFGYTRNLLQYKTAVEEYQRALAAYDDIENKNNVQSPEKPSRAALLAQEKEFVACLQGKNPSGMLAFHQFLTRANTTVDRLQREINIITFLIFCSAIIAIGAGLGFGLAALPVCYPVLTALTTSLGVSAFSAVTMNAIIYSIGIFAGLGYALMIFKNLNDVIRVVTSEEWKEKVSAIFQRRKEKSGQEESALKHRLRCFSVAFAGLAITALSIFTTIATAGSWWPDAKEGILLLSVVSDKTAILIRNVAVALLGVGNLVWSIANSIESACQLANYPMLENAGKAINRFWKKQKKKNWGEFINPFYWIDVVVSNGARAGTFVGHSLSVGATAVDLDGVPRWVTEWLNSLDEAIADSHFIFDLEGKHTHHHHHAHDHHDHHEHDKHSHGDVCHGHHHDDEEDDDEEEGLGVHNHADIAGAVTDFTLYPVRWLSKGWDSFFKSADGEIPGSTSTLHVHTTQPLRV